MKTALGTPVVLGTTIAPTGKKRFGLTEAQMATHKLVSGISGMGKSKLMSTLCVQLLNLGIPFACIDPHTDLADDLLSMLWQTGFFTTPHAYERLWYITFADPTRFVPFNWLKQPYSKHQMALNFVEVVKRAWTGLSDSAVNLENITLASVMTLLENNRPLIDLTRLLNDQSYRESLLAQVNDAFVVDFFHARFASYAKASSESTLRRAFLLNFSPPLRFALGASENLLDFTTLIDQGRSVIFDLGGLDEQTQRFLGVLLTVGFEMAMLARATLPATKRKPYHLFIDEWHQFLSQSPESLERMLNLTRKFGLTLTLSAQNFAQTAAIRAALQNCLQIAFRLGHDDAHTAAPRFIPALLPPDAEVQQAELLKALYWERQLKQLDKGHALVHLEGQTIEIETVTVPPLISEQQLSQVKDVYAKQLLRPISEPPRHERTDPKTADSPLPPAPMPTASIQSQASQETQEEAIVPLPPRARRRVEVDED